MRAANAPAGAVAHRALMRAILRSHRSRYQTLAVARFHTLAHAHALTRDCAGLAQKRSRARGKNARGSLSRAGRVETRPRATRARAARTRARGMPPGPPPAHSANTPRTALHKTLALRWLAFRRPAPCSLTVIVARRAHIASRALGSAFRLSSASSWPPYCAAKLSRKARCRRGQ